MKAPISPKLIWILLLASLSASLGITGCGNILRPVIPTAMTNSSQLNGVGTATSASTSGYSCPAMPNVMPDNDALMDGSGRYSVCTSSTSKTDIQINGENATSSTLCIFPVQTNDPQHVYTIPGTNGPLNQCYQISSQGINASFPGITFNSVFIVNYADEVQMSQCLTTGNFFECPIYSYGTFR